MISAGNDIVALKIIDKQRTNLPAFYLKFIAVSELALYAQPQMPFDNFVWLLWSVKEAAYKYLKRFDHDLVFSPSKIIVKQVEIAKNFENGLLEIDRPVDKFYIGTVFYDSHVLHFRSMANNDFMNTVINDTVDFSTVYWGVKLIAQSDRESQSKEVRAFILDKLNTLFPNYDLLFGKALPGYPVLLIGNRQLDIPLSFSHHDRYVSYSFRILK